MKKLKKETFLRIVTVCIMLTLLLVAVAISNMLSYQELAFKATAEICSNVVTTTTTTITTTSSTTTTTTVATTTSLSTTALTESSTTTTTFTETTTAQTEVIETTEAFFEDQNLAENYVFSSGYVKYSPEYIMICNCVAHEAGSDWIDLYEKAKVVDVILNRVSSSLYPNTVEGVLTEPGQFSGSEEYVYLGCFSYQVTDSVIQAVDWYLDYGFWSSWGYYSFWGDGTQNYFS